MSNTTTAAAASKQNEVRTPLTEFWRKFKKQKLAVGAGIFVLFLVAVAILAPWIVPFDPENFFDYDALNAGPSLTHWLGVDSLGRDIFSRILMGARISLAAGFLSVAMGAVVGTFMGLMAGYYQAGGSASPCASRMCCWLSPACCWPSAWWPSWARAWSM